MTKTVLLSVIGVLFLGAITLFGYHARTLTPAAAICTRGDCPTQLYHYDSGERLLYAVGERFYVYLDKAQYPPERLRCLPEGVVGAVSNAPTAKPPLYAAAFEGVKKGTCMLQNGDFYATIVVE